jgi:3-oxoacyl-[acyl-carrier protein] reductase
MFDLTNKVALVTGGSRGIGRACCEALAEHGATVVVNYVKGEAQAREVAQAIVDKGGKADIQGFDVGDAKACEAAVDEVVKRHGRLDILVANAGISIDGLLLRLKEEDLDRLFQINVKGALACAKAATKTMMRARTGRIIFVSSVVGEMGNVGQTAYSATKAAIIGAGKSIAREFASRSITVNTITPGYIETDMTNEMAPAMKEQLVKLVPLGRIGAAREVAAACLFLASDEAAYVTGQVLRVNGGLYV